MEVTNRFKGLDPADRLPEDLLKEVCDIVQKTVIKNFTKKKNCKKENGCLTRPYKKWRKEEKLKAKEQRKEVPV